MLLLQVSVHAARTSSPARRASVSPANTNVTIWRTAWTILMKTTAVRVVYLITLYQELHEFPNSDLTHLLRLYQFFVWRHLFFLLPLLENVKHFLIRENVCLLQTIPVALRRRVLMGPVTTILSIAMGYRTAGTALMNPTVVSRSD